MWRSLLAALQQGPYHPPRRLDEPGLLSGFSVHAVTWYAFPYASYNLVLFQRGDRIWTFTPPIKVFPEAAVFSLDAQHDDPIPLQRRQNLTQLMARTWQDGAGDGARQTWLAAVRDRIYPGHTAAGPPLEERSDDFAPLLHADLWRRCEVGDRTGLQALIALLDRLAGYAWFGREELELPFVTIGGDVADRIQALAEPQEATRSQDWQVSEDLHVLLRLQQEAREGPALRRTGARFQVLALTERWRRRDGTTGAYYSAAVVRLEVDATGWRIERQLIYQSRHDGIELS